MEHGGTRRSALRGLMPTVVTVAVVVGGAAGGRAGGGVSALLVAVVATVLAGAALGGLAVALIRAATRGSDAPDPPDLATRWAEVEPVWSGRVPPRPR